MPERATWPEARGDLMEGEIEGDRSVLPIQFISYPNQNKKRRWPSPGFQSKTPPRCHPGAALSSQTGTEISLSLSACHSLICVCVTEQERARDIEEERESGRRGGGGDTRKDARLAIQSLSLHHGVFSFNHKPTTCKHEPKISVTIYPAANLATEQLHAC